MQLEDVAVLEGKDVSRISLSMDVADQESETSLPSLMPVPPAEVAMKSAHGASSGSVLQAPKGAKSWLWKHFGFSTKEGVIEGKKKCSAVIAVLASRTVEICPT